VNALCAERDLLEDLRGDGTERSQQTRLGKALQASRDRVFGGLRICMAKDAGHKGRSYALERVDEPTSGVRAVDVAITPAVDKLSLPVLPGAIDPWADDEGNLGERAGNLGSPSQATGIA